MSNASSPPAPPAPPPEGPADDPWTELALYEKARLPRERVVLLGVLLVGAADPTFRLRKRAWRVVIRQLDGPMHYVVRSIQDNLGGLQVDDILQEARIKVFLALPRFVRDNPVDMGGFINFAIRITQRVVLDALRAQRYVPDGLRAPLALDAPKGADDAVTGMARADRSVVDPVRRLEALEKLAPLSEIERKIVALIWGAEMTTKEAVAFLWDNFRFKITEPQLAYKISQLKDQLNLPDRDKPSGALPSLGTPVAPRLRPRTPTMLEYFEAFLHPDRPPLELHEPYDLAAAVAQCDRLCEDPPEHPAARVRRRRRLRYALLAALGLALAAIALLLQARRGSLP